MAQAKKKAATKTAAKTTAKKCTKKCAKKGGLHYEKYDHNKKSNLFFVITMSVLAATLLFADLLMLNA